jgi:uncharacterized protein
VVWIENGNFRGGEWQERLRSSPLFLIKALTVTSPYLAIAQQGKNSWKRYLSGLLVLAGFLLLASIQISIVGMLIWGTKKNIDGSPYFMAMLKNAYGSMIAGAIIGIAFLTGLGIVMKQIHYRNVLSLISSDNTIQWTRVAQGLGLWLGLRFFGLLICSILMPTRYILTFNSHEWFLYTLLALICLPIFALIQHLAFYAYLLQGMGLLIRHPSYLAIAWGLFISIIKWPTHPLIWLNLFANSVMICWIILKKENRQELAIGFTCADVFVRTLFFRSFDTLPYVPTIFTFYGSTITLLGPVMYLLELGLFYYFFFGKSQKPLISNPG